MTLRHASINPTFILTQEKAAIKKKIQNEPLLEKAKKYPLQQKLLYQVENLHDGAQRAMFMQALRMVGKELNPIFSKSQ